MIPAKTIRGEKTEAGQGLVEYALILVLIAIVIIVVLTILAPRIPELLQVTFEAIRDAPRYLQIVLVVVLLIPLLMWLVRLAPQLPKVLGIDVRQLELVERDYQRIESEITGALLGMGMVKRRDVGLNTGLWKVSVQKYIQRHRNVQIRYNERQRAIVTDCAGTLMDFNKLWHRLHLPQTPSQVDPVTLETLDLLARTLSGTVTPIPEADLQRRGKLYVLDLTPWNSPLPSQLPVLIWLADDIPTMEEIRQLHHQLLTQFESIKNIAVFIDLATDYPSRSTVMRELFDRLRDVFAYDFTLFGYKEIASVLIAKDTRAMWASLILPHVNLISISPFILTGPAPDAMFFGRESEMREIAERVTSNSYVLIAGRRFGKSSALLRLHRIRLPAAGFRTIYHDCSVTPTSKALLSAALHDWQPEPPPNPPTTFGEFLQSPPNDKPLVLFLDEADKLVPADRADGWQLFNKLRALSTSGRAQVVLSGERTLRDALRDPKSPLFNFPNEILLGPLDRRAAEELITRPMKQLGIELTTKTAIIRRIYAFTSGHPNIVQRLCHRLIELLNVQGTRRITLTDVDAIIEDPGFQRDDFLSTYWESATPLERIVSLLMADDGDVRTLSAVRQVLAERCDLHPQARDVDAALQRLTDLRSILKRTPSGYTFAVEAFPRVVAGRMTLDDMLETLTEEYEEQSE